jgi:hypothetical protein
MSEYPNWMADLTIPRFIDDVTQELEQLANFRAVASYALGVATKMAELLVVLQSHYPENEQLFAPVLKQAAEHQPHAAAELESGMSYLGGLLIVRLVTIVETCVSDAVVWALKSRPEVFTRDEIRKLKGPLVEFIAASEADRAEFLASALARETRATLKVGVAKYESLLNLVGLGGIVNEDGRRLILELTEIRNIVVHRNGRADAKFVERCPWLHASIGNRVTVSESTLARYAHAVSYYLVEILGRCIRLDNRDPMLIPQFERLYSRSLSEMSR